MLNKKIQADTLKPSIRFHMDSRLECMTVYVAKGVSIVRELWHFVK